jgi:Beta-galactosidase
MRLKKTIACGFLCLAMAATAFADETPEEKITIAADGNFLDAEGNPTLLLGTQVGITAILSKSRIKAGDYPPEFKHIYQDPINYESMKCTGFNTLCLNLTKFWTRSMFPGYKGYKTDRPIQDEYNELLRSVEKLKRHRLITTGIGRKWLNLFTNIKMPVYLEIGSGKGTVSTLFQNKNDPAIQKLAGGKKAFSDYAARSSFAIGLSLGTPEGLNLYRKIWRYAAEELKNEGGKALAYELFNEPKYNDPSKYNRQLFGRWLEKKYASIENLNKVYKKRYKNFKSVSRFKNTFGRDFPALGVDWGKFMQTQVINACKEAKKTIRKVDPKARFAVQVHGRKMVLFGWHNFDIYRISKIMDIINTGTGGFAAFDAEGPQESSQAVINTGDVALRLRWGMLNSRVWLALAGGKPLLDGEMYTGPSYDSLSSMVWSNVVRGHNAVYLFSWTSGWPKLNSKKEAQRAPYSLLNQSFFKPEGLRAIKNVKSEIMSLADFFLPRKNRVPAECAMLISYPTIKYDCADGKWGQDGRHSNKWPGSAIALGFGHYPFDAVFEEQLTAKEKDLKKYKVLFADNVANIYSGTQPILRDYVKKGGVLVANIETLGMDGYGNPINNPLFDLKLQTLESEVSRLNNTGGKAQIVRKIQNMKDWTVVDTLNGEPAILKKPLGKGWLYYIAAQMPDYSLRSVYSKILNNHKVDPMGLLQGENSNEVPANVEMHKATHNSMTAWYFMNCDCFPKIVRLKSSDLKNSAALNPLDKRSYDVLDDSLIIFLPPFKRQVVVSGSAEALAKRFGTFPVISKANMITEKNKINKKRALTALKNKPARPGRCLKLDNVCNSGFDNQQNWATDSAWIDKNYKYLVGVPWHGNVFDGVKCNVIRMDFNNNKTCIALKSKNLPNGLKAVRNIPVKEKVKSISFFQAVTNGKLGKKVMTCYFKYKDGSSVEVPVVVGKNIGDWNINKNNAKLKKMLAWSNDDKRGFFRWEWMNPHPQKKVLSLSIISTNGESTPIIVGITTHLADKPMVKISLDNWKFHSWANGVSKRTKNGFEMFGGGMNLGSPNGKRLPIPKDKMNKAFLRYSINNRPDKWGKRGKLNKIFIAFRGTIDDGTDSKTSSHGREHARQLTSSSIVLDDDPETWQETSIPLKILTDGKITNITRLSLGSLQNKTPVLVRDIRIEYEKE